jgi:dTDP-4-dehydrorhamnose reductase
MQINGVAPGVMAEEALRIGALLVHYSTDYVFDGESGRPYCEEDAPRPVNEYGRSKLVGESAIAAIGGAHLILRTSWMYSSRRANFVLAILRLAREKPELRVVADQTGSPTWARALAVSTADLLRPGRPVRDRAGIYHLCAAGRASRYEFAQAIVDTAREVSGISSGWASVKPITTGEYPLPAQRPRATALDSAKIRRVFGIEMTHWREQLRSCVTELAAQGPAGLLSGARPG